MQLSLSSMRADFLEKLLPTSVCIRFKINKHVRCDVCNCVCLLTRQIFLSTLMGLHSDEYSVAFFFVFHDKKSVYKKRTARYVELNQSSISSVSNNSFNKKRDEVVHSFCSFSRLYELHLFNWSQTNTTVVWCKYLI